MEHRGGRLVSLVSLVWLVWLGGVCAAVLLTSGRARAQDAGPVVADAGVDAGVAPATQPEDGADAAAGAPADTSAEEAEIAAEMAAMQEAQAAEGGGADSPPPASESSGATGSSRGLSNLMNPAISAAGTLVGGFSSRADGTVGGAPDDLRSGIDVQEVEIRASAIVDPFFRADVSITGNTEGIAVEEAFITTLELPRLTLRAGQFAANLGRHNILHTHAFPFITAPLPWRALLGPEGLRSPGVSADLLLPLPFYAELNAQVFAGEWSLLEGSIPDDPLTVANESVPDRRSDRDLAYVGHLKTLFDLGEPTTLELGVSYLGGRNGFGGFTNVVAGDVTLKWRPLESERYFGFDWTTEYLWVQRGEAPSDRTTGGAYTAMRLQFGQQWWIQVRGALLGLPAGDAGRVWRAEALAAFVPSEFSAIRLQYAIEADESGAAPPVHEVFAQMVFSVGPHPAHAY